jgi:hypothetical protein
MKKLNIDFDEIQKAMEDTVRDAFDYFLDFETGDVIILSEDILNKARYILAEDFDEDMADYEEIIFDREYDMPDWIEEEIELALDIFLDEKNRYIRIPERNPGKGFSAMQEFTERLENIQLKEHLLYILDGKGAFRRFKNAIDPFPKEKKAWYGFNAKHSREEIREWLSTIGIEHDNT